MILSTFWRFSQLIIIIIRHSLLELFQNVIGVRFFLRHSVHTWLPPWLWQGHNLTGWLLAFLSTALSTHAECRLFSLNVPSSLFRIYHIASQTDGHLLHWTLLQWQSAGLCPPRATEWFVFHVQPLRNWQSRGNEVIINGRVICVTKEKKEDSA